MPELAEVEYYRRKWLPAVGRSVTEVHVHAGSRVFRDLDANQLSGLEGASLEHSEGHGKQMIFRFGRSHWLGVHLGMTGSTSMQPVGYQPARHDHLVLVLKKGGALVFTDPRMFGRIRYSKCPDLPEWWRRLTPAVTSPGFTRARFDAFLDRRGKAPIKAVLLMQEGFPGVGNWMADEILWRARIHPATPAGQIGPRKRAELHARTVDVAHDALRVIGNDWSTPPDDWLFNHRWKDGGRCPRSGRPLRRAPIGGRTTCWSPSWQVYRGKS